jgi:phasin family protein
MADKKTNPFYPFGEMDFSNFDITRMVSDLKVPGVDVEGILAAQRKNIEALTQANQLAVQGMQAVAKRQAEILSQSMTEVQAAAQELSKAGDAQTMTAKQAELVKSAFEKALANMRELAEMVASSNTEAFDVINKRFAESLNEVKALVSKK